MLDALTEGDFNFALNAAPRVFRAVEKPTYEALLAQQVENAVATRGAGDLASLLRSGDTWSIQE
jgi:hypothetical protein